MTKLQELENVIKSETTLHIASHLTLEELQEIKEHFTAKREGLLDTHKKVETGEGLKLVNAALQEIKALISKTNKAIGMVQIHIKEQKEKNQSISTAHALRFYELAHKILPAPTFNEINNKVLKL